MGWRDLGVTLSWVNGAKFLGFGSFYANGKYNCFALAYSSVSATDLTTLTYYLWIWDAGFVGTVAVTAAQSITQYQQTALIKKNKKIIQVKLLVLVLIKPIIVGVQLGKILIEYSIIKHFL